MQPPQSNQSSKATSISKVTFANVAHDTDIRGTFPSTGQ
ncbi:MAG: hypothetical protein N838_02520 [Thiohalocapsa sp. PB-PSB1]|nr:MAG: hypothetical protein N838_02520 [Thiohalocapsa sp. PB-PSB1]